eukprot:1271246-Pyramimonas_sp.AAC.1
MEINDVDGFEDAEEARELLRTPAQRRAALGIDKFLTSQKPQPWRRKALQAGQKAKGEARKAPRKATLGVIRNFASQGYSAAQAFPMSAVPKSGSKAAPKSKRTAAEIKKARLQQALARKRQKDREKAAAEAQAAEDEGKLKQQSLQAAWQDCRFLQNI